MTEPGALASANQPEAGPGGDLLHHLVDRAIVCRDVLGELWIAQGSCTAVEFRVGPIAASFAASAEPVSERLGTGGEREVADLVTGHAEAPDDFDVVVGVQQRLRDDHERVALGIEFEEDVRYHTPPRRITLKRFATGGRDHAANRKADVLRVRDPAPAEASAQLMGNLGLTGSRRAVDPHDHRTTVPPTSTTLHCSPQTRGNVVAAVAMGGLEIGRLRATSTTDLLLRASPARLPVDEPLDERDERPRDGQSHVVSA